MARPLAPGATHAHDMSLRPMPVLFIGQGAPANAIEHNAWSDAWRLLGAALPRPRAILCVSPYWQVDGVRITGAAAPPTLAPDGAAPALPAVRYPARGDPLLARRVAGLLGTEATIDHQRGLDVGAWGVLLPMFPDADIPVVQLGLDPARDGHWHYHLAQRLQPLRDEGVLLLCSGNIVHNPAASASQAAGAADWAPRFRDLVDRLMQAGDYAALMRWPSLPDAARAAPDPARFLPLLYALANGRAGDKVTVFNDDVAGGVSMTCLLIDVA